MGARYRTQPAKQRVQRSTLVLPKQTAVGLWLTLFMLVGCAPAGPDVAPSGRSEPVGAASPQAFKTITIAQLSAVKAFSSDEFSNTSGGGASLSQIHINGLVANGSEPRIASKLPSFEDGSIVMLPDGQMRTVWKLRPEVTWHDGQPFTADDVVFSWQVAVDPLIPSSGSVKQVANSIERVEALDRGTASITWKNSYFHALELGYRELWPLPRHVLGTAFQGDKEEFLNLAYWSVEYMHLGPFRLVDFGLGERLIFERYDAYFLGQPKVDRIIVQTIPDPNVMLANLKSGAIDIATEKTLPLDVFVQLRNEWRQSDAGVLVERQDNWRYIWFQFDPQWARPIELSQDVRVRRGLLYGLDRDALRDFLLPGFADSSGDSFMPSNDPRAEIVGQPYARYHYDPARAAQELADAGWRRAADGRALNATGDQVQFEVRGDPVDSKETALIADNWRRLGIDITETISPVSLARNAEYKSKFPGAEPRARSTGDQIFASFDSREHSIPQNRWTGTNSGHYSNLALDQLIDRLYRTVDEREQGQVLREMGELMAADLPAIPMYYRTLFAAVGKSIRGLSNDYASTRETGGMVRNSHLWDRD
ncbi:MAG: hypothetical protein HW416_2138 [Chloroflexi bacterium]|nr:hypothetical protein [Chloroflexota bacterium]